MSVVVLDFGSQYTLLIARRLRELGAFSVVLPGDSPWVEVERHRPQALILSGGPASVFDPDAPGPDPALLDAGLPILGICYGMQYLAHHCGGEVKSGGRREYGRAHLVRYEGPLFAGISGPLQVWMSHTDAVTHPPPGWEVIAETEDNPVAAIAAPDGRTFGVQFHPEVVHTDHGTRILANFLGVAGVSRDWSPSEVLDRIVSEMRSQPGRGRALVGVSGGVDSSALALLLARAGIDHVAVFVDHGLLRL
ncbi:MAG: glutamine-hydrolyzing GMP synthase, partial [Candidatus Acetothermia bacterium]|nr:glutamine-hydrolyzing GMP synthase [Candidatus Acetothermia bacterium]